MPETIVINVNPFLIIGLAVAYFVYQALKVGREQRRRADELKRHEREGRRRAGSTDYPMEVSPIQHPILHGARGNIRPKAAEVISSRPPPRPQR